MTRAAGAARLPAGHACPPGEPIARVLAQKTATAYVVIRLVRLLQSRGALPGHTGMEVAGVHVHHLVHGGLLLSAQHLVARRRGLCLHRAARANALCIGAALVLDEFDIVTQTQGHAATPAARAVLDLLGLAGALVGAVDGRRTWLRWH